MKLLTIPAHFDGNQILLDEPVEIQRDARLLVTVLPAGDDEHQPWLRLSLEGLIAAYGDEEPEYGPESVRQMNPEYAGG